MKKKRHGVKFSDEIEDFAEGFEKKTPRPTPLQLEKREALQVAQKATRERKLDTRRKIVFGGQVLSLLREGRMQEAFYDNVLAELSERDRELFDGWKPWP